MKKIIMTLAAVLCCWVTLYAQPLTEQEAKERALKYINSNKSSANARRMAAPAIKGKKKLTPATTQATKIYAFNIDGGGFVIASGDKRTLPVLGYSTTGSIDWEHMSENMRSWLKHYDEAIATLGNRTDFVDGEQTITSYGQNITTTRRSRRAERVAVEPLIKTHWDQEEPYWNQVPKYQGANPDLQGNQCYVGCVATAMAQVMNFWQWPKTLPDGLSEYDYITDYNDVTKTWHLSALPPTWFDWDNMLDDYSYIDPVTKEDIRLETTEAQDNAVATLMRYCGQSVKMMYGTREIGGSSAATGDVAKALVNNFDYNAAQYITHQYFPGIDEWEEVIYGELAAGRPMVYCGASDEGGHCFVCDGYDGNGLFHINWGWSGHDDGYFALAVLNPYNNTSAGSGSSGIGFSIREGAVIYTDPKMDAQPPMHGDFGTDFYQYLPIQIVDKNLALISYTFFETYNEEADGALGTIDNEGHLHPLFMADPNNRTVFSCNVHNYNYFAIEIDSTLFSAGQAVTLYPMLRFNHPGEEWQIVPPMEQNLTVGCDNNGQFFIHTNKKAYNMNMFGIGISAGTGRLGERSDVTIRVHNFEASDYVNNLHLVPAYLGHIAPEELYKKPALAYGEAMECGAYIPANGDASVTFSFEPEYGGIVVFCAYTENGYIGELPWILDNDTLTDYDSYLENKSYLSKEGDQWYWNLELADRIGVKMPHWIPSDSLCLYVRQFIDDDIVKSVRENTGLKEYLAALPDYIGTGFYTFTYKMPVEVGQSGDYFFDSYLAEMENDEMVSYSCGNYYQFIINDPNTTNIEETIALDDKNGEWFDLNGRRLSGKPNSKGVYIHNGRKHIIK